MTWALLGGLLLVTSAFVTLTFLNRKDGRELIAARDRIEKLDEEYGELERDRNGLTVELAAARELLAKERDLRAVAESQRNTAFQQARDQLVERIKKSNVADAQRLVADLLAAPLPGFVPQAVPEGRATAPGPDRLINPWVQPSDDPGADR